MVVSAASVYGGLFGVWYRNVWSVVSECLEEIKSGYPCSVNHMYTADKKALIFTDGLSYTAMFLKVFCLPTAFGFEK
jgi:hypothetical protein